MEGSTPTPAPSVPLLGRTMEDALDAGLRKAGVFCSLCGRSAKTDAPTNPTMMEYLVIDAEVGADAAKKPTVALIRFYHCERDDCDATELKARAQAARRVPAWEVLVPEGATEEPTP